MMWDHLDLTALTWTVPKTNNKTSHRIPLSDGAVALLKQIRRDYPVADKSGIAFVGDKPGRPMSKGAMLAVCDRMGEGADRQRISDAAPEARACFKSWALEETSFEKDVIEACLSHAIPDEVEAVYRRADFYRPGYGIVARSCLFRRRQNQLSRHVDLSVSLDKANARIGHPLTPGSVAGVNRRVNRRSRACYAAAVGAGIGAAAVGAAAAGAYYGGYGYPSSGYYGEPLCNAAAAPEPVAAAAPPWRLRKRLVR